MNRWTVVMAALLIFASLAMGCSGHQSTPITPDNGSSLTQSAPEVDSTSILWGYYHVTIDTDSGTAEAIPDRSVMFAANVVSFLNSNPAALGFASIVTDVQPSYIDVTLDVSLTHPFVGLTVYNGYDVRGVLVGDGSGTMGYNSDLKYARDGMDQWLMNADGYTRWFNAKEFTATGLLGFTDGAFASKNYTGQATLNGYKYFADSLTKGGDLWDFLTTTANNGVFTANASPKTRTYDIRFPVPTPGVVFDYAVVANWEGEAPEFHPANAPESQDVKADITPNVYYVDNTSKGGNLKLDLNVQGWASQPTSIFLQSTVLTAVHELDAGEMTPTGGTGSYSTYHVDIPADNVTGNDGQEFWVICEYAGLDYSNDFGVPNTVGTDPLAAFFRFPLFVANEPYNQPPTVTGVTGNDTPFEETVETYSAGATDPDGDTLTYTWTVTYTDTGDPVTGYDGVPGDGAGALDLDYSDITPSWALADTQFNIDCVVDDGFNPPVDCTTLTVTVTVDGDVWVSNNPAFTGPGTGTQSDPYTTIAAAIAGSVNGNTIVIDNGGAPYFGQIYFNYGSHTAVNRTFRGYSWYTTGGGRPTINYSSYMVYMYYADGVTLQGIKFEATTALNNSYMTYLYYCNDLKVQDCLFTGSNSTSYSSLYALRMYYCGNQLIRNNKFYHLTCGNPSYGYLYTIYSYQGSGYNNKMTFIGNELTDLMYDTKTGSSTTGCYGLYLYYPAADTRVCNNLLHHVTISNSWPTSGSGYYDYCYYTALYDNYAYATSKCSNNVIDKWATNYDSYYYTTCYGMSSNQGGSSTYGNQMYNNIVSNIASYVNSNYGIYFYNLYAGYDTLVYNDVYNTGMGIYQYPGTPDGSNINSNPLFVNNTTAPYDYHLDSGSPCIGTGQNGADMGIYDEFQPGEFFGLATPE